MTGGRRGAEPVVPRGLGSNGQERGNLSFHTVYPPTTSCVFLSIRAMRSSNYSYQPSAHATTASSNNKMPCGVPNPEAGMTLGPYTEWCACGGVTGICGMAQGDMALTP
jgi:hypothetical protein